jgi:hypothetical protein
MKNPVGRSQRVCGRDKAEGRVIPSLNAPGQEILKDALRLLIPANRDSK